MPITRLLRLAVAACALLCLWPGQAPAGPDPPRPHRGSHFPLQVGNEWVYGPTTVFPSGYLMRVEVPNRVTESNGRSYFVLRGYLGQPEFFPDRPVATRRDGVVSEFNPDGTEDNLWYLLNAPVGTAWTFQLEPLPANDPLDDCRSGTTARIGSRTEVVEVPAGRFTDVVRVDFLGGGCYDAGVLGEFFAPGVGLIRRVENTFYGPETIDLLRAKVGGEVLPRLPYTTALSLDRAVYLQDPVATAPSAAPTVTALFTLRNATADPLSFTFDGCRSARVSLTNEAGEVVRVSRATDGGGCCGCAPPLEFWLVNDTLVLGASIRLLTRDNHLLPLGRYTAVATLEDLGPAALHPAAASTFELQAAP